MRIIMIHIIKTIIKIFKIIITISDIFYIFYIIINILKIILKIFIIIAIKHNPWFVFSIQSRSMISLIPEDRKREFRSYGLTPMAAPAAYKYFSRSDFYNTTAIYNRSLAAGYGAPATRQALIFFAID